MLTPIHNCLQANLENEYYKEKLTEFYKENKSLKEKLKDLKNQNDELKQLQSRANLNDVCTQTNENQTKSSTKFTVLEKNIQSTLTSCSVCDRKKAETENMKHSTKLNSNFDNDTFNKQNKKSYVKLCEMQHSLLKKYENEVNANAVKQDLINHMKLELDSLESSKKSLEQENSELQKQTELLEDLDMKHKRLILDYEQCKLKCKKYKNELKCFDQSFFDELEELKLNYNKSTKLNHHYENLLHNLNKKNLIVNKNDAKKSKNRVKFELADDDDECFKSMNNEFDTSLDNFDSNNTNEESVDVDKLLLNEDYKSDSDLDYEQLIEQLAD